MFDDGGCGGGCRREEVPTGLVDAVGDGGEGHHGFVEEAGLIVVEGFAIGADASLRCVAFGEGGPDVLCVFCDLADGFGRESGGAFGEGVDAADVGVGGGGEGHGFGGGGGFGRVAFGLGCEGFGDVG